MGSITLTPGELKAALADVKGCVDTRSPDEAASGVRITVNANDFAGAAMLAGSCHDTMVCRAVNAQYSDQLDVGVSHAELERVSKAFAKSNTITLTAYPDTLVCGNESGRIVTLKTLLIQHFPGWVEPAGDAEQILRAPPGYLRGAIEKASTFRSKDETRLVLTGIMYDRGLFVTTDSYKLAKFNLGLANERADLQALMPGAGLDKVAKRLDKKGLDPVTITGSGKSNEHTYQVFHVSYGDLTWSMRGIDGQYPNYRQLLPDTDAFQAVVSADTAKLMEGAKLGKMFCTRNAPIRFTLENHVPHGEKDEIQVARMSGQSADGPSFDETISEAFVHIASHEPMEVGANPAFVQDILSRIGSERTRIRLISPMRPLLFENPDDADERYLLMPIRLNV